MSTPRNPRRISELERAQMIAARTRRQARRHTENLDAIRRVAAASQ